MVKLKDMRAGSIVMVRTNFGGGPAVRARVEDVCEDVKNGRPGIDYFTLPNDTTGGSWAYLDAVDRVITY